MFTKKVMELKDWLELGERKLLPLRYKAMDYAGTNEPLGGAYNREFSNLIRAHGLSHLDKTQVSACLWLLVHPEAKATLDDLMAKCNWKERRRINTPTAAKKIVLKTMGEVK